MTTLPGVVTGLSILIGAGLASADEPTSGQTRESVARVLVLEDGTRLCPVDGPVSAQLGEGVTVMLTYEVRNGQQVVTRIETAE